MFQSRYRWPLEVVKCKKKPLHFLKPIDLESNATYYDILKIEINIKSIEKTTQVEILITTTGILDMKKIIVDSRVIIPYYQN